MEKATALFSKVPDAMSNIKIDMNKVKSTEATVAAAGIVGTISAVQLLTDWNPVGRCLTFWKQLRSHVSKNLELQKACRSDCLQGPAGVVLHFEWPTDRRSWICSLVYLCFALMAPLRLFYRLGNPSFVCG